MARDRRGVRSNLFAEARDRRRFVEPPLSSDEFVARLVGHLKRTGQPETFPGLYYGHIARDARFTIVRKITIDRRKRPDGDMAPCPRCGCGDKFLEGALAHFPSLQCCAVVGHCCADKTIGAEADREYQRRTAREQAEDFLLSAVPLVARKLDILCKMAPAAGEALRVYRKFRKEASKIQRHLRALNRSGGVLRVAERARDRAHFETHDRVFGPLEGTTALISKYDPVRELEAIRMLLADYAGGTTAEATFNYIVSLTADEDRRLDAHARLRAADQIWDKFSARLRDFRRFWARDNLERLDAYGAHPDSPFSFQATYELVQGRPRVTFRHRQHECRILLGAVLDEAELDEWPCGADKGTEQNAG
jgi:hypothetical protein